ncbi:hypothetical protein X943_001357 [Babesia divergens]|uniref:Ig-like domain-containing protein n=1 Tax=Babesia divergens TaxID=32595 RepID=A0AAD9G6T5_BABDI|nr:hypothetical protein X943_001357 [Babesia divergens]
MASTPSWISVGNRKRYITAAIVALIVAGIITGMYFLLRIGENSENLIEENEEISRIVAKLQRRSQKDASDYFLHGNAASKDGIAAMDTTDAPQPADLPSQDQYESSWKSLVDLSIDKPDSVYSNVFTLERTNRRFVLDTGSDSPTRNNMRPPLPPYPKTVPSVKADHPNGVLPATNVNGKGVKSHSKGIAVRQSDLRKSDNPFHMKHKENQPSGAKNAYPASRVVEHTDKNGEHVHQPTTVDAAIVDSADVQRPCSCCVRHEIPDYEASRPISWVRRDELGTNVPMHKVNIAERGEALYKKGFKLPMAINYKTKSESPNCIHIDLSKNNKRSIHINTLVDVPSLLVLSPKDPSKYFCKVMYGEKTLATLKDITPEKTFIVMEKVKDCVQFSLWVKTKDSRQHLLQILMLKKEAILNNNYPLYLDMLLQSCSKRA